MSNGLLLSFSAFIYQPNVLFLPTFFRYSQPVKNEINMNHFDWTRMIIKWRLFLQTVLSLSLSQFNALKKKFMMIVFVP